MIEENHFKKLNLLSIKEVLDINTKKDNPLSIVAKWCVEYLCNPHPDLGRPGAVCPWSPTAIKKETFWLAEVLTRGRCEKEISKDVLSTIDIFKQKSPQEGESTQYKTIVMVFHEIQPESKVEELHAVLKPQFLDAGLMLGEFHSGCDKRGLRNHDFHPLKSPLPLLVVREMLEFDIVFLTDSAAYISAYLKHHGERGKTIIRAVLNRRSQFGFNDKQITILSGAIN